MKTTYFGLHRYSSSLQIQNQALKLVESTGFPVVLGFEFYPTFVANSEFQISPEFLKLKPELLSQGVEVVEMEDSEARFYSPGQLIIYPLVPLKKLQLSLLDLTGILEESTRLWLQKYKIDSFKGDPSALATSVGPIAFLNPKEEEGISRFGISIDLANDLIAAKDFNRQGSADSILNHGVDLDLKTAFDEWILYWTSELLKAIPNSK